MVDIPQKTTDELVVLTSKEAVYIAQIVEELSNLIFNPNTTDPNQLELSLEKGTSK